MLVAAAAMIMLMECRQGGHHVCCAAAAGAAAAPLEADGATRSREAPGVHGSTDAVRHAAARGGDRL